MASQNRLSRIPPPANLPHRLHLLPEHVPGPSPRLTLFGSFRPGWSDLAAFRKICEEVGLSHVVLRQPVQVSHLVNISQHTLARHKPLNTHISSMRKHLKEHKLIMQIKPLSKDNFAGLDKASRFCIQLIIIEHRRANSIIQLLQYYAISINAPELIFRFKSISNNTSDDDI